MCYKADICLTMKTDALALFFVGILGIARGSRSLRTHELGVWIYWLSSIWALNGLSCKNKKIKANRKMETVQVMPRPLRLSTTQLNSLVTILFSYKYSHRHNCRCQMWKSIQFISFCFSLSRSLCSASWLMCRSFSFHLFCYYFYDICCCCGFYLLFIESRDGRARARTLQLFWASIIRMASETT